LFPIHWRNKEIKTPLFSMSPCSLPPPLPPIPGGGAALPPAIHIKLRLLIHGGMLPFASPYSSHGENQRMKRNWRRDGKE
jgi:hypothetical protein